MPEPRFTDSADDLAPDQEKVRRVRVVVRTCTHEPAESPAAPLFPGLLSEAERERAVRFRLARDRWSYCAAHALLRAMLAEFHGGSPLAWAFRTNAHGRPEVDPAAAPGGPVRFNLSHTHGLAACALTVGALPDGVEVGVDAEVVGRRVDSLGLAERFFSSREARWLSGLPEAARNFEFLRLWTLKEAVAKAAGVGLGIDLKSFDCSVAPPAVAFAGTEWGPSEAWELRHWATGGGHLVSLAVRRPPGFSARVDFEPLGSGWERAAARSLSC